MRVRTLALISVLALAISGCDASEPSDSQMKDAMNDALNNPTGGVTNSDPIRIASFK
jgi:hypothetical protein